MKRVKRWQLGVAVAVLLLCVASLLFTFGQESHGHVSLDSSTWEAHSFEGVEFSPGGTQRRSIKGYHIGPVVISFEDAWMENTGGMVSRSLATNGSSSLQKDKECEAAR